MIYAITATNATGYSKRMELTHPEDCGVIVGNTEGLGPVTATVNLQDPALLDGAFFNSARVGTRNITMALKPMADPSVEVRRHELYKLFQVKKPVALQIETDTRTVKTTGYVESNEPSIFSDYESQSISVICPDPYFYKSGQADIYEAAGVTAEFEFPFSNESMTENLIEFGDIPEVFTQKIYYEGDAEAGAKITIGFVRPGNGAIGVKTLTIRNTTTGQVIIIDFQQSGGTERFSNGFTIVISCVPGNCYANQKTFSFESDDDPSKFKFYEFSVVPYFRDGYDWITVVPGLNVFTYSIETDDGDGIAILEVSVECDTKYVGV